LIELQQERFSAVRNEIGPLWDAHYDEVDRNTFGLPLDPDWNRYAVLDDAGLLLIVTARLAGKLVGYVFALVDTHLHYRSTLFASLDLYYLAPAHRGGRTALRLFLALSAALKARGVKRVLGNTKAVRGQDRLFQFMGWVLDDRVYIKTLGAA
jgi:GNAT superfamily N-acetyltransferase